jgi:hypothetical protein
VLVIAILLLVATAAGCSSAPPDTTFEFEDGPQGWVEGFADYPADGDPGIFELEADWRPLPENLDGNALYISGHNRSDDLWMQWAQPIDDLEPNTEYTVSISVELASSVPEGLVGIGGSPGESVYIKAGASTSEPTPVIDDQGWWRLTADKGNQANGGDDAVVIGTPANPNLDPETADGITFELMTLDTTGLNLTAVTDETGTLWVFVGSDSGFEGATTLYYNTIDVQLTVIDE